MNYTNEQLDTIFDQLHPELQEYIMSEEVKAHIQDVINEYAIIEDTAFRKMVFTLLLGITTLDEFITYTTTIPHTGPDEQETIINEITTFVLYTAWEISKRVSGNIQMPPQAQEGTETPSTPSIPLEHPLPATTTSQAPITALLEDPHHGEPQPLPPQPHHDGPIPLSKSIPAKDPYGGHDPYREDPVYELK